MDHNSKENLKEFIRTWEACPEIWNRSCEDYKDKLKKIKALDKLLDVNKKIKPDSTRHDIRKKINLLRTNFRREYRKMMKSKSLSNESVYVPRNWLYYELKFLGNEQQDYEAEEAVQQKRKTNENYKEENAWSDVEEVEVYSESSVDPLTYQKHCRPINTPKQTIEYQPAEDPQSQTEQQEEDCIARIWAKKLKKLDPVQKLYAEKAINDILFEAELQNLEHKKDL